MLENKSNIEKYVKLNNIANISSVGEIRMFIENNIHLDETELLNILKFYIPIGIDDNYLKSIIMRFRRQEIIRKVLNK